MSYATCWQPNIFEGFQRANPSNPIDFENGVLSILCDSRCIKNVIKDRQLHGPKHEGRYAIG